MTGSLREQWLIVLSTPFYLIIIGLEIILSHLQERKVYSWKDTASNLYLMLLNSGIDLGFRIVYIAIFSVVFSHRIYAIKNPFAYWFVLVLAEDFIYYWLHRFDHSVRMFWAVHVTHHSSENMNFTVGFRSSVFQPLYRFIYFLPLPWLGFRPLDIVLVYSATQIWGIFVHTELIKKMGVLELFMVTPSHHRVHHASNPLYLDRNMGMLLIIWDRLFGTFQPEQPDERYQPKRYGLTSGPMAVSALSLVFHEWRAIIRDLRKPEITWKNRFLYLFGPPGWSHDGRRHTSRQLRDQEAAHPVNPPPPLTD